MDITGRGRDGLRAPGGSRRLAGIVVSRLVIRNSVRGRWHATLSVPVAEQVEFDLWQTSKGAVVVTALLAGFFLAPWPREALALAAGGLLLSSRRMASRRFLGMVDWNLLVLFAGLFVVNHALRQSGMVQLILDRCRELGADPSHPAVLFGLAAVLSNLVSNVPATMLLLPAATHPLSGTVLALASTFAGNLLIVGSIANIIVIEQAERLGVHVTWKEHARIGVPITLGTLIIAGLWLFVVS